MVGGAFSVEQVREVLPDLAPFFHYVERKADGYSFEDFCWALMAQQWTLHRYGDEGFLVVEWDGDTLFVVAAMAFHGHVADLGQVFEDCCLYAEQSGCCNIGFKSIRPAWRRVAQRHGFTRSGDDYCRSI